MSMKLPNPRPTYARPPAPPAPPKAKKASNINITFPPEYDGELHVTAIETELAVTFSFTLSKKYISETPKEVLSRAGNIFWERLP